MASESGIGQTHAWDPPIRSPRSPMIVQFGPLKVGDHWCWVMISSRSHCLSGHRQSGRVPALRGPRMAPLTSIRRRCHSKAQLSASLQLSVASGRLTTLGPVRLQYRWDQSSAIAQGKRSLVGISIHRSPHSLDLARVRGTVIEVGYTRRYRSRHWNEMMLGVPVSGQFQPR